MIILLLINYTLAYSAIIIITMRKILEADFLRRLPDVYIV